MSSDTLQQDLTHLKEESNRLTKEELVGTGDKTRRYQAARRLNEQLLAFRKQVDSAPRKQKGQLDLLWRAAERDLTFLLFAADKAEKPQETDDIVALFQRFGGEVFSLAKALANGQVDPADAQQQGFEMYKRLKEMTQMPGVEQPEVQQSIVETRQEITWICSGGKGPTSLRLHHHLKG
jgi:hypothetical protein